MFVAYSKKNGVEYATATESVRSGNKVVKSGRSIYLGKVIDKEKGIYCSRERGTFTYDPETNTFGTADLSEVPLSRPRGKEKLVLDFGDSYFLNRFMEANGYMDCIRECGCDNIDTFAALVHQTILTEVAFANATLWYEGNYARLLYPKADMDGRRISDFLETLGDEDVQRRFFEHYIPKILDENEINVAFDSTGLPNNIHFPLTAINNHNGDLSREVRLILVTQLESRLPVFFRAVPGNIIDSNTLLRTLDEMSLMGVDVSRVVVDAGYCDLENLEGLSKRSIAVITRLKPNLELVKHAIETNLSKLDSVDNLIRYGERILYVVRDRATYRGHEGYVYLVRDMARKGVEDMDTAKKLADGVLTPSEAHTQMQRNGLFALFSSEFLPMEDVLPTYYARQGVEQFIDIGKNYANMVPLRIHSEKTFNGLMLLTFLSAAIVQDLMNRSKSAGLSPKVMFLALRNLKCKVFENVLIRNEYTPTVRTIMKHFGYELDYMLRIPRS
ncbi:MAG: transposase [Bacteroidales bacterium]|nr:transposase [Bacteroidales bacterium]